MKIKILKKHHYRNRRAGVSEIIGSLFLIAIIATSVASFFIANQYFANQFRSAVMESTDMDKDMIQEQFAVGGFYDSSLKAVVNNTGPVPITIVHVFIINQTTGMLIFEETVSSSNTINPGDSRQIGDGYASYSSGIVLIKVLTSRGNAGSGVYPTSRLFIPQVISGPFALSFDIESYTYTASEQTQKSTSSGTSNNRVYQNNWIAQSFTPVKSDRIERVAIYVLKSGSPVDNLVVEIRANSGGVPGAILASATIPPSQIGTSYGWRVVDLTISVDLTGDTKYWIVLHQDGGSSSNYYRWSYSSSTSYTRGERKYSNNGVGGPWSSPDSYDFAFKTYMTGSAYTMSSGADEILLFVKITNYSNKDIEFSRTSVLMVDIRDIDGTAESETYFFLLKSTSTSAQPVAYSPDYNHKVLGNGGSTILVFGASQIGGSALNNDDILTGRNSLSDENLAWVFVVIFWRFSDLSGAAGQTILYNAIHILDST
ncbi:MAG: hypothetical protein HXX80_02695 [Nitrososphaerales archaeon]|nr:hypothetical protein [Nitrososphaerales archaeon]